MREASEQKHHKSPLDWQETDCPQVWAEGGDMAAYDWFEDEGPVLDSRVEIFHAPAAAP